MFSLMQLTPNAHGFSLAYHAAVGATLIALALVIAAVVIFRRAPVRRRWPAFAAIVVAGASGFYFATFEAVMTGESVGVRAFMQDERILPWKNATDIYLERRAGQDAHIVVVDRHRRTLTIGVADLARADRDSLVAFMASHVGRSSGERTPTAFERPASARGPGFFSDQQI